MKSRPSFGSFAAGLAVGLLIGSVGMAGAALKAKGWHRFSQDFRMGYLHGFFDMAEVARKAQPGGMIEKSYPYFPNVRMLDWYAEVDRFFADPENSETSTYTAIATAAREIEKKHGPPMSVIQREAKAVAARIQAAREAQAAHRAKLETEKAAEGDDAESSPTGEDGKPGPGDGGDAADKGTSASDDEKDLSGYWDPKEDPFKRKRRRRDCCPCPAADPAAQTEPATGKAPAAKTEPATGTDPAAQTEPATGKAPAAQTEPATGKAPAAQTEPATGKAPAAKTEPAAAPGEATP